MPINQFAHTLYSSNRWLQDLSYELFHMRYYLLLHVKGNIPFDPGTDTYPVRYRATTTFNVTGAR